MDFTDCDSAEGGEKVAAGDVETPEKDGPTEPVVDSDVQNELMTMNPLERLAAIDELMQQALGEKLPRDEQGEQEVGDDTKLAMEASPESGWFQCDVHNLRILKAITLDSVGQTEEALRLWEESIKFVETRLPVNDESGPVLRAQAALCAAHAGEDEIARRHAEAALRTHDLLFGGGVSLFRRRLDADLKLALRPVSDNNAIDGDASQIDILWPLSS
jgi:hypothetical protein